MSEYDNEDSTLNTSSIPKDVVDDILDFETGISTNTGFLSKTPDEEEPQVDAESEGKGNDNGLDFVPYIEYRHLEDTEIEAETVYNGIVIWDEELEELDSITDVEREELEGYLQSENPDDQENVALVEEPEPEPEITYTEDEYNEAIAKALAEGQSIGFDAGKEQALSEAEVARQGILETISERFGELKTEIEQSESAYLELAVNVAMGIVKKLFPSLAFKYNTQEILNVIELAVELAATQPRLIVRMSEEHKKELEEQVFAIAQSHAFEGRLVVRKDDAIGHTNVQIDWGEGSAIRDPLVILSRINNTLAGVIDKSLWDCDLGIVDPDSSEVKKDANSILSENPTKYNIPGENNDTPPPIDENPSLDDMPPVDENPSLDDMPPMDENPSLDDMPPMDENPSLDDDAMATEEIPPMEDLDNDISIDHDDVIEEPVDDLMDNEIEVDTNQETLETMEDETSDFDESMEMMGIESE